MADPSARWPYLGTVVRRGLAGASLGAGLIHAAATFDHAEHRAPLIFFVTVAVVQVTWGLALLLGRWSGRGLAAGAVLNAGVAVVWVMSRTAGLSGIPGAEEPEAVGLADGIATGLELVLVAAVASLIPVAGRRLALASGPLMSWLVVAGVGALTTAGLAAPGHHDGRAGHRHDGDEVAGAGDHHDEGAEHSHGTGELAADGSHESEPTHGHGSTGEAHAGDHHDESPHSLVPAGAGHGHDEAPAAPHGAPGHQHTPGHVHPESGPVDGHDHHQAAHGHPAGSEAAADHPHEGADHDHGSGAPADPGHDREGGGHDQGGGHDHEGGHDHCSEQGGDNPVLSQLQKATQALGLGCVHR
jgi:hypothetical protein